MTKLVLGVLSVLAGFSSVANANPNPQIDLRPGSSAWVTPSYQPILVTCEGNTNPVPAPVLCRCKDLSRGLDQDVRLQRRLTSSPTEENNWFTLESFNGGSSTTNRRGCELKLQELVNGNRCL